MAQYVIDKVLTLAFLFFLSAILACSCLLLITYFMLARVRTYYEPSSKTTRSSVGQNWHCHSCSFYFLYYIFIVLYNQPKGEGFTRTNSCSWRAASKGRAATTKICNKNQGPVDWLVGSCLYDNIVH